MTLTIKVILWPGQQAVVQVGGDLEVSAVTGLFNGKSGLAWLV